MSSTLIYDSHFGRLRSLVGGFSQKLGLPVSYILLVFSFIVNFVCGVVISTVLPDAEVNNYFTDKRNVINRLFVKQGWLWTTIAVSTFYLLLARTRSKPDVLPAIGRYAVATISWVVFTQWFFGSPIMDKIFVATGGHCMVPSDAFVLSQHFSPDSTGALVSYGISSAQCRATRGLWRGGIDPSGHVFLLVHSMIYLFIEGSLLWDSWSTLRQGWVLAKRNHPLPRACLVFITNQPHIILLALLALWWWMLLMTNMYFHSALEKCGGLIGGIAGGLTWHYGARFYNTRSMEKLWYMTYDRNEDDWSRTCNCRNPQYWAVIWTEFPGYRRRKTHRSRQSVKHITFDTIGLSWTSVMVRCGSKKDHNRCKHLFLTHVALWSICLSTHRITFCYEIFKRRQTLWKNITGLVRLCSIQCEAQTNGLKNRKQLCPFSKHIWRTFDACLQNCSIWFFTVRRNGTEPRVQFHTLEM